MLSNYFVFVNLFNYVSTSRPPYITRIIVTTCVSSSGMEGLANIIRFRFHLDPYDRNTLFLFCGKRSDRIKGLLWEGDGFLLLYKRLDTGAFS